jgi:hypothetical protein
LSTLIYVRVALPIFWRPFLNFLLEAEIPDPVTEHEDLFDVSLQVLSFGNAILDRMRNYSGSAAQIRRVSDIYKFGDSFYIKFFRLFRIPRQTLKEKHG